MNKTLLTSLFLIVGSLASHANAVAIVSVGEGGGGPNTGSNQSATGRAEYSIETVNTSAFAYADVASGKMGARFDTNYIWGASATASISENIYFNVAGATSNTVTPISIYLHLDGDPGNASQVQYQFRATRDYPYALSKGGISINPATLLTGHIGNPDMIFAQGCYSSGDPFNFDAVCTFNIHGASDWIGLSQSISAGGYAPGHRLSADFSHTAGIKIVVPEGVTWTSGSGAFLTSGIPEPSTWAIMITGFGAAGAALRTSRRRVAVSST